MVNCDKRHNFSAPSLLGLTGEEEVDKAQHCMSFMRGIGCYHHLHYSTHKNHVMKQNMGTADRLVRIAIAALFAGLYFTGNVSNNILAMVLWVVGIVFIVTSAIGFCPLYTLFGIRTIKRRIKKV
jgi:hypothetical protein